MIAAQICLRYWLDWKGWIGFEIQGTDSKGYRWILVRVGQIFRKLPRLRYPRFTNTLKFTLKFTLLFEIGTLFEIGKSEKKGKKGNRERKERKIWF